MFVQGDWFTALPNDLKGRVDVAIATPPYLSSLEYDAQDAHVKASTPKLVMLGGETGLEPAKAIASQGREWLSQGGCLLLECHPNMVPETAALLSEFGYRTEMNSWLGIVKAWNQ
jgi:release factor glutamine methyltransferase